MPGKKALERKEGEVKNLSEKFDGAKGVVILEYRGITVDEVTGLRNDLRKENVYYKVAKNSLAKLAIKGTDYEGLAEYLEGPTAIVISHDDCTAPARIVSKVAEEVEALKLKAAWAEGSIYDAEGVKKLAKIPSKEVLIAQILGGFNSPIASLAYTLKAIADKKEAEANA
ncbi:MAG: 50S ribosomal protein L10 [Clostridia bacterium]|nr:50S ribosomal protein L10 [Clostridia bacterium]